MGGYVLVARVSWVVAMVLLIGCLGILGWVVARVVTCWLL